MVPNWEIPEDPRRPKGSWNAVQFVTLTHLLLGKLAAISQTTVSNAFFLNEKFRILIEISLKFVPKDLIDNNPALV